MSRPGAKKPHGQLRQGQLISTFGPGAMLDLPNHSVLIAGLEHWSGISDEIIEPRLAANAAVLLGTPSIKLFAPPADLQDPTAPINGVGAWQFPEWFIVQQPVSQGNTRSRLMVKRSALNRGKYIDDNKKRLSVVPIRFVRACPNGHIGDIDWHTFVHVSATTCVGRQLWIDERGTSGDLAEVWIRCDCKLERNLSQAAKTQDFALGKCNAARPWLGPRENDPPCGVPNRLLIRNASNAYFPQLLSVISLPDRDEKVKEAVDLVWEDIEAVESLDDLRYERRKARIKSALQGFTDDEVLKEIMQRKTGMDVTAKSVKVAELETLMSCEEEIGGDQPHGNFLARRLPKAVWQAPWMNSIEHVVLVHRLREVVAQVGFSRFEAVSTNIVGELEIGARRAAISRTNTWIPAVENKGEGIFLQFKRSEIEKWAIDKNAAFRRGKQLEGGFNAWLEEHKESNREYPKLPYILLHSFSHMLITSVALECGYPASSIRERIYAIPDVGYGILLYTASSDAEGTLGGLVEVGRRIHLHVRSALQSGELCSNDPICAEHRADNDHERRFLLGAACHGCLLIAETSCEQHNDFLDRALVVPTLENIGAEFFKTDKL